MPVAGGESGFDLPWFVRFGGQYDDVRPEILQNKFIYKSFLSDMSYTGNLE